MSGFLEGSHTTIDRAISYFPSARWQPIAHSYESILTFAQHNQGIIYLIGGAAAAIVIGLAGLPLLHRTLPGREGTGKYTHVE